MKKFGEKASRARSQAVAGSQNNALRTAVLRNLSVFKQDQKVKRRKDGKIFTVRECTQAGLRFYEADGLFSPDYFEKVRG